VIDSKIVDVDDFRVRPGAKFRVKDYPTAWLPDAVAGLPKAEMKERARQLLTENLDELRIEQDKLYASDTASLLLVFQAMDAAGKDSTIAHVMSGINPQGCQVFSFKVPSSEELDHDYLWRYHKAMPERGRIGIFNRSYYEEVLVVRVHPEILARQRIPGVAQPSKALWKQRYDAINAFEEHLSNSGTRIVKFFLNVSREEQRKRFMDRLDDPTKNWKFSTSDVHERAHWDAYMEAFEDAITATSTEHAPWYVIPADRKFVMRSLVSEVVLRTLQSMKSKYPVLDDAALADLAVARATLLAEDEDK